MARTSAWWIRISGLPDSGSPRCSRYENMRPEASMRGLRFANEPSMTPSERMIPARYMLAITSMMPEPQIPVTSCSPSSLSKPGSSDQRLPPMTLKRGSRVTGSILTRSMAPGAARWPPLIWAPSKAGPVGLEAVSSLSRLPSTISALVPTSMIRLISSESHGVSASRTAEVSAPTWPAMHGRR